MNKYIIATSKNWFNNAKKTDKFEEHNFTFISNREDLNLDSIEKISPRFIFFPHWNWMVPEEIYENYNCIAFHTSPLPFGRGGSPIQNLILRKYKKSPVCALRMNHIIDGGPIYLKKEVSLSGNADQIFHRLAEVIESMIIEIIEKNPQPKEQVGEVTSFERRTPSESELPKDIKRIVDIYDHIRMLDADQYPKAFIEYGDFQIEFTDAIEVSDAVQANALIRKK